MDQNIDFFGSDQIQTPHYPDVHLPSQEISDEVFHAKGDLMKSIQIFLEEFNCIPFEEKATILLQAWFKFFAIKHDQPENSNELFQKLLEDLKELTEYKESLENSSTEIDNMENTIRELVEICRQKELLCIHDNVDDLIESALNSKLLSINSQRLDNKEQEVKNVVEQLAECRTRIVESLQNFRVVHNSSISLKNTSQISSVHAVTPILSTKEPAYSSSTGYEHSNTNLETESDEIIKSGVENLVPILSENEVTSEDKKEYDDILSDDDAFEDIEYAEASLSDPEIVNVVLREKLLSINRLIANIESLNDNPTPNCVLNSFVSIPTFEESNNSISDNFSQEFETFCDHTKETRSGNTTTHADDSLPEYDSFCFEIEPDQERLINTVKNVISDDSDIRSLEALLINDSIPNNESSESDFDNPPFPRPPPEPPDAEFNTGDEISVMRNTIVEFECLDPRDEFDDDDYSSFMFDKVFSFLFAESDDTIFDPGISI
nr:hypothetical protein [Tanacetum cinerariifolium]